MKSHEFPDLNKRAKEKQKLVKDKASHAVANGIRVTFSVEPVEGETAFARQLRISLQEREGHHDGPTSPKTAE